METLLGQYVSGSLLTDDLLTLVLCRQTLLTHRDGHLSNKD